MKCHAEDGVIVRLSAPAGEDDFLGAGVDEGGNLFARGLDGGSGALAEGVDRRGVAEFTREEGKHGVEDGGVDGGGGIEIEVDAVHGSGRIRIEGMGGGSKIAGQMVVCSP